MTSTPPAIDGPQPIQPSRPSWSGYQRHRSPDLRKRYRELFRTEPPKAFGPDLLRRSIAHRIQEKAYGGLARGHQASARPAGQGRLRPSPTAASSCPDGSSPAPILVRTWNGKSHRVTVVDDGFAYAGQDLSPACPKSPRLITGTRWNGPRFFGLRTAQGQEA